MHVGVVQFEFLRSRSVSNVVRGSRQTINFMEYDGPLERTYMVQVLGE
jgi:hypothetical protein